MVSTQIFIDTMFTSKGLNDLVVKNYLSLDMVSYLNAGVAQLAEHQPSKLRVAGSIPVSRSIRIHFYY